MRSLRFLAVICAFSTALIAANNPFIGTWKLNNAKSKFAPGNEIKEMKIVFQAVGDQVKRVASGIDVDGEPIAESSMIAWDGQDHAIEAPGITVAVTPHKRELNVTVKQKGKIIDEVRATAARNGKTMTVIEKGVDLKGRPLDNTEIFEKQ